MLMKISPDMGQLRHFAEDALGGFETLDLETAAENAKADLKDMLTYLDRTDDAVLVFGASAVELGVLRKGHVRNGQALDQGNLEVAGD